MRSERILFKILNEKYDKEIQKHKEGIKKYEGLKIPVLRTDINGAITVETDGARLKVSAYKN